MTAPAHVFVCYSALSLDAALRVANMLVAHEATVRCYFFVLFEADPNLFPPGARVFRMRPPPHAFSEWIKPFAIARWFSESLREMDEDSVASLVAYLPHPFELPGNHFLFFDKRVVRVELLPDGLGNYLHHSLHPESVAKFIRYGARLGLRLIAAGYFGLGYRPYSRGHITQYERGLYARSWTHNEDGYITRSSVVETLPSRLSKRVSNESLGPPTGSLGTDHQTGSDSLPFDRQPVVLILDQELHPIVSSKLDALMRERLISACSALQPKRVLYKAHPRGKNRSKALRRSGLNVEDQSGSLLAEDLIQEQEISHLLGYYSTPLVLSKYEVRNRISVFPAPAAVGVVNRRLVNEIGRALRGSGVHILSPEQKKPPT